MGEAKRRQSKLGDDYGQPERILPWLPITKQQSEAFVTWTTRGAWLGIALMVLFWVTVRFIGPAVGWWTLVE
ncbi:DUF2839 domain-containing protein [Leptothoe kymatousa]|uniref:DUF2839 domain-containing protein n=1 Tax=Leptothoe kymatousa TAU-MAC 1615 TaxID=2364775 RepID=A0ABS5Y818_9CYAN|nr:DUF2839 domain-containing protein [Leptothoe kymatousa]MBT9313726.1 DUF2839 domain-containing protein [Leptothoe kymatousa TAU-MAC 1615]